MQEQIEYAVVVTLNGFEPKAQVPTFKQWDGAAQAASKIFWTLTNQVVKELQEEYYDPQTNIRVQVREIHY